MIWCLTEKGKRMPVDADLANPGRPLHVENGNLVISKRGAGADLDTVRYVKAGSGTFRSHFASCPNRQSHRRS